MNPEQHRQSTDVSSAGSGQGRNGQAHEPSNGEPGLVSLRWLEEQLASDVVGSFDLKSRQGIELAQEQLTLLERLTAWRKQDAEATKAEAEASKAGAEAAKAGHQEKAEIGRLKARSWREWSYLGIVILLTVVGTGLVVCGLLQDAMLARLGAGLLLAPGSAATFGLSRSRSAPPDGRAWPRKVS